MSYLETIFVWFTLVLVVEISAFRPSGIRLHNFLPMYDKANGLNADSERYLGSYEILLSRKTPGSETLALSHGCIVRFNKDIDHQSLVQAVALIIQRHPLLRMYIEYSPSKSEKPRFRFLPLSPVDITKQSTSFVKVKSLNGSYGSVYLLTFNI